MHHPRAHQGWRSGGRILAAHELGGLERGKGAEDGGPFEKLAAGASLGCHGYASFRTAPDTKEPAHDHQSRGRAHHSLLAVGVTWIGRRYTLWGPCPLVP